MERPTDCTNFKLRQLARRVSHLYDAELGKIGLKTTQYSLLTHVVKLWPVRPVDLAEAMAIDASTLTRNLKPLVEAGFISVAEGSDGRSHAISITDAGRAKRNEGRRCWQEAQERLAQLLGVQNVVALHGLIDASLEKFAQPPESAGHD
jgi:DNA-binding MarR family transcriptional regulator